MILVQGQGERQTCQIRHSFTSGYPRHSRGAQRVGWVERSDTHPVLNEGDGFREGLNPSRASVSSTGWCGGDFSPSWRANGSRECAPDDRLGEAIHLDARQAWIASSASLLAMTAMQKLPDGQITSDFPKSCQAPFAKIFPFAPDPNQMHIQTRPAPTEGRRPSSRTWRGMRWTRGRQARKGNRRAR